MDSLVKRDKFLAEAIPITVFLIWDTIKQKWSYKRTVRTKLCAGVWINIDDAEKDKQEGQEIIDISLEKMRPLLRIAQLDNNLFSQAEKKDMVLSKLRQLLTLYVFRNEQLKESLKERFGRCLNETN